MHIMKEKKYFHELSQQEIDELIRRRVNWQYIVDNYKQPDWCGYPNALAGSMGCWSLTNLKPNVINMICIKFCKTCIAFKKDYHEDND